MYKYICKEFLNNFVKHLFTKRFESTFNNTAIKTFHERSKNKNSHKSYAFRLDKVFLESHIRLPQGGAKI